jgi:zinc transporter, ZIP family
MSDHLALILPYILIAAFVGVVGGLVALFWKPNVRARSAIQHFAAGGVIAAIAIKVIPEAEQMGTTPGILGGFAAGGLLMIGMKWIAIRSERNSKSTRALPVGLAAAAATDTLLDGAIISVGFSAGPQVGALLTATLAIELFFLTLSVGGEFRKAKSKPWLSAAITTGIASLLLMGAFTAGLLFETASDQTLAILLAFGAAALIYLVAEELLVEAIQAEESIFSTAMLFSGFLVIMALELFRK